jgi:hypothetical protein
VKWHNQSGSQFNVLKKGKEFFGRKISPFYADTVLIII